MGTSKIKNIEIIEIQEKATFIVTEQFLNQVKYINSKISEVEWSGIIFYSTKGSPSNLNTFKIEGYYIHLMDEGSSAYTEFDSDDSILELYKKMPELDPFEGNDYRSAKIHSHHNMEVFHSGTDIQDLVDQTPKFDKYYLSVISNNDLDFDIKMSFIAKVPNQKIIPTKFKGMQWSLPKKEVLVTIDFEVEMPENHVVIPEALKERIVEIKEAAKVIKSNIYTGGYPSVLGGYYDQEEEYNTGYQKEDIAEYRTAQGKMLLRNFLHDFFNEKIPLATVFDAFDKASPNAAQGAIDAFLIKYKELGDWSKQNILYLIEDDDIEDGSNLETLYSAIWNTIKVTA